MLEQPQQIVVLPVDVPHDLDRRLKFKQRGLVDKEGRRFVDQEADLVR